MSDTKRATRRKPPNKHQPTKAEMGRGHRDPGDAGSPRGRGADRRGAARRTGARRHAMIVDRLGDE